MDAGVSYLPFSRERTPAAGYAWNLTHGATFYNVLVCRKSHLTSVPSYHFACLLPWACTCMTMCNTSMHTGLLPVAGAVRRPVPSRRVAAGVSHYDGFSNA